jgi:SAM-dependent methyltransferase
VAGSDLTCVNDSCGARFPSIDGIPVLLNEQNSVFTIEDFRLRRDTFFRDSRGGKLKGAFRRIVPNISGNVRSREHYERLAGLLLENAGTARVLVLGGSVLGNGMEALAENPAFDTVDTDVSFGPRTKLICDAHDVPFADGAFDAVIVQAVLEHVVDPVRCVEEVCRVLKKTGFVYAETPFMQQVHGGRYDFTRFTHLGHRRLFRRFEEIESGAVCGPGMALAWSYLYFLTSFGAGRLARALARSFACFTSFHLKYFDRYLIDKPGTLDCASGYYFLGRKSDRVLSDRELVGLYRGAG